MVNNDPFFSCVMKSSSCKLIGVAIIVLLASAGYVAFYVESLREFSNTGSRNVSTELIKYAATDIPFKVTKETVPLNLSIETLKAYEEDCGVKHDDGYLEKVVNAFHGVNKTVYRFKYYGESQGGDYLVTVAPNAMNYASLDDFNKDFGICSAGADEYPSQVSSKGLMFVGSCGTGYDDGSGRPHGCELIQGAIGSSLKLNVK